MGKIDSVERHKGRRWLWMVATFGLVAGSALAPDASQGDPAERSQSEVFLFGTTTLVGGGSSQLVRTIDFPILCPAHLLSGFKSPEIGSSTSRCTNWPGV